GRGGGRAAAPRAPPGRRPPVADGRPVALRVRELAVSYDDVPVLFDVDLDADAGEIVALLGTNGSGKSTLLAAVSGLRTPDRGEVMIAGRVTTRARPGRIVAVGAVHGPGGHRVVPSRTG